VPSGAVYLTQSRYQCDATGVSGENWYLPEYPKLFEPVSLKSPPKFASDCTSGSREVGKYRSIVGSCEKEYPSVWFVVKSTLTAWNRSQIFDWRDRATT
jgi:hypothetical protein